MAQAFGDSENNAFRDKMWGYLRNPQDYVYDETRKNQPRYPDIRESGDPSAEDEELMRMIMAYLGSGGWMDYKGGLDAQRGRGGTPAPAPSPVPTQGPRVGGPDMFRDTSEQDYKRMVGGR